MLFKPGGAGGPGRPKGSRNKLAESFLDCLYRDFQANGEAAVQAARAESPLGYCKLVASLLPKELEVKRPMADLSDDELINAIEFIRAAIASDPESDPEGDAPAPVSQKPAGVVH
jgi:hypothetical protein